MTKTLPAFARNAALRTPGLWAGALAAALCVSGTARAQTAWDLPTPYPEGNFHEQNLKEFADEVNQKAGDAVKITLHYNQSLIKHPDIKNSVRDGIVPAGELLVSRLENDDPIFGADSVPFLATSYEQARKLYAAQKPLMEKALQKEGLKLLYSVPWPPQGLYTKDAVAKMGDLQGKKFRAYNNSTEEIANLAGMIPTQIEQSDVPTAFSTGRVEAMMTSPATGVDVKAWDFLKHYYVLNAWLPRNMVIVNQQAFDALPKNARDTIASAAATAEERGWKASMAETDKTTKTLKDNGIDVSEPSADLKSGFEKIGARMTEEWKTKAGAAGEEMLKAYRQ